VRHSKAISPRSLPARPTEEGPDQDDESKDAYGYEGGIQRDRTDNVGSYEKLEANQDRLAKALAQGQIGGRSTVPAHKGRDVLHAGEQGAQQQRQDPNQLESQFDNSIGRSM